MKGRMISLATETERTLFFDFMPLEMGEIKGFKVRLHLYTVPGQVFYNASRKLILRGVDGVIFVADSQEERFDANIEAIYNLKENLREENYDIMELPYVLQLNKRDLPSAMDRDLLAKELIIKGEKVFDAIACQGIGVTETLKEASKQVLMYLRRTQLERGG
jgi:mutual gliding-motility protein MglA